MTLWRESLADPQTKKSTGNLGCLIVGLIGIVVFFRGCSGDGKSDPAAPTAEAPAASDVVPQSAASLAVKESDEVSNWSYDRRRDEVRNGDVLTASISSENSANLEFPYQGDNYLNLTIRKHPEYGLDVIIRVDKGQILCHSYSEPCSGTMNIDGRTERLTFFESADNDSSVVFASYPAALIKKLKNSNSVIIELPFFQNGNVQFKFKSKGLEWPPKQA